MTVAEWLESRTPPAPAALSQRLLLALGGASERDAAETPEVCLAAAEAILHTLLTEEFQTRERALDLLAADALVTYAFEAASDDPEVMEQRAARAMGRIAALGTGAHA